MYFSNGTVHMVCHGPVQEFVGHPTVLYWDDHQGETPTLSLLLVWEDGIALRTDALLSMLSINFNNISFPLDMGSHLFSLPLDCVNDGVGGMDTHGGTSQELSLARHPWQPFTGGGWKIGRCRNVPCFRITSQLAYFSSMRVIAFDPANQTMLTLSGQYCCFSVDG